MSAIPAERRRRVLASCRIARSPSSRAKSTRSIKAASFSSISGYASANRPSRLTSHLAAKSGHVLTVIVPERCRCSSRSVPSSSRSNTSRTTGEIAAPGLGDDQTIVLALEELKRKLDLERLDLVADGALRQAQLLSGAREALVPGRGVERPQRVQRWQQAAHDRALYT